MHNANGCIALLRVKWQVCLNTERTLIVPVEVDVWGSELGRWNHLKASGTWGFTSTPTHRWLEVLTSTWAISKA
jgi:hypothetical protein